MVMVLSLHESIAVATWLTQAVGTLPDTIVTKQVVASMGTLGTLSALANILAAVAVIVLVAVLIPAALSLRRVTDKAGRLVDKLHGEVSPLVTRANKISDNVDSITGNVGSITDTVRAEVEDLSRTARYVAERARLGVEGVEQRVGELNTLLSIAQNELEHAVVSTAATLHGVQAGVAALGEAPSSRTRRSRRRTDARDHDEELDHDHRDETRNPERIARPRPQIRHAPAPRKE